MLLVRITPPAEPRGSFKLAAEANWLVCEDVCIPEDGKFELTLPVDGDRRARATRHPRDLRQGAPAACRCRARGRRATASPSRAIRR